MPHPLSCKLYLDDGRLASLANPLALYCTDHTNKLRDWTTVMALGPTLGATQSPGSSMQSALARMGMGAQHEK